MRVSCVCLLALVVLTVAIPDRQQIFLAKETELFEETRTKNKCYFYCGKDWIGDGVCDKACYTEECKYDGGDCDKCFASGCTFETLYNGECNEECNIEECTYDIIDC